MKSEGELLAERDGRRIFVHDGLHEAVVELLADTEWGTSGPRYRVLDEATELSMLAPGTRSLSVWHGARCVAGYTLSPRRLHVGGKTLDGYYRGLLSVSPDCQGAGVARWLVQAVKDHYLHGPGGADFMYGFIEEDNVASLRVSEHVGFRSVGRFESSLFSRTNPKRNPAVERVEDPEAIRAALSGPHPYFDPASALEARPHWALREAGRVVAVVSARPKTWRFTQLPGVSGFLARHFASKLPVLSRLFDADDFRFLILSHAWAAPGHEGTLGALVEDLLAQHDRHVAMAYLDRRADLHRALTRARAFGLLQGLGLGAQANVMAGFRRGLEDSEAAWSEASLQLSPWDDA